MEVDNDSGIIIIVIHFRYFYRYSHHNTNTPYKQQCVAARRVRLYVWRNHMQVHCSMVTMGKASDGEIYFCEVTRLMVVRANKCE